MAFFGSRARAPARAALLLTVVVASLVACAGKPFEAASDSAGAGGVSGGGASVSAGAGELAQGGTIDPAAAGRQDSGVSGAPRTGIGGRPMAAGGMATAAGGRLMAAGGTPTAIGGMPMSSGGMANRGGAGGAKSGGAGGTGGGLAFGGTGGVDLNSEYRKAILGDRPLAYWRMGTVVSNVVPDATGNGNHLVLQGAGHALGMEGAIRNDVDGALGFDGAASFAVATNPRAFDFANNAAFTIECWAKRRNGGASYFQHLISSLEGPANNRTGYALYILPTPTSGDTARTVFEYDLPAADLGSWGPLPAEALWSHYAATYDGAVATLYVDGSIADTSIVHAGIIARVGPFFVARDANGSFFRGSLDELAVYPRALGAADLDRHFAFHK